MSREPPKMVQDYSDDGGYAEYVVDMFFFSRDHGDSHDRNAYDGGHTELQASRGE